MLNPSNVQDALDPAFSLIFFERLKAWEALYPSFVTVVDDLGQRRSIKTAAATGYGYVPKKAVGAPIATDDMAEGFSKEHIFNTYALASVVARETYEDDLFGMTRKIPEEFGKATQASLEKICADLLNDAFASGVTYGDGKSLCATNHPTLKGSATLSNRLATDADFGVASFWTMVQLLRNTKDHNSKPAHLDLRDAKVVCPVELERDVMEALYSAGVSNTANRADNMIKKIGVNGHLVNPWLTDTDAWFITLKENGLRLFMRLKAQTESDVQSNGDYVWKTRFRALASVIDWMRIAGTSGA